MSHQFLVCARDDAGAEQRIFGPDSYVRCAAACVDLNRPIDGGFRSPLDTWLEAARFYIVTLTDQTRYLLESD